VARRIQTRGLLEERRALLDERVVLEAVVVLAVVRADGRVHLTGRKVDDRALEVRLPDRLLHDLLRGDIGPAGGEAVLSDGIPRERIQARGARRGCATEAEVGRTGIAGPAHAGAEVRSLHDLSQPLQRREALLQNRRFGLALRREDFPRPVAAEEIALE